MDYEKLSSDKKQIILDLAVRAICLKPSLAGIQSPEELPEKITAFARTLAGSIEDSAVQ
ncbi:MAG: hypothetical protein LBL28_03350 [Treponema sp.]|jgi:hypothetical protein|nr:hypothetical protein [Treponema sp.]